ncbi:MAG: hypothetical protein CMJ58_16355 [Planctomycetaceae bacterium]|nr:hypothetical protein [Planctomycetaceae bacterium]
MSSVDDLFSAAQSLGPDERWQLANRLWDSMTPDQWPAPPAAELQLVRQRSQQHDQAQADAVPWTEVQALLRRRVGDDA